MAQKGWVAIYRKIQDHWLWEDKPFSKQAAWVDMLLLANHDDNKILLGNELIEVRCGSFITSIEKLKLRWGWSNTKVINFFKLLENDEMITRKSDTKKTVVTIVKYSDYAVYEKTKTMRKRCESDTETMREHTNNNDNNENNDNNIFFIDDAELNAAIVSFVEHRKDIKKPMTDHAIKLMISKLNKMAPDISDRIEILNQSIVNGWQGIFPLKKAEQKKKTPASDEYTEVEKHIVEKWAKEDSKV